MNWLPKILLPCVFLLALTGCGGQSDTAETMPVDEVAEYERLRLEAEAAMVDPAAGPQ